MNNIKVLLNYNFNPSDIADQNFDLLFEKRRRDSCFAFVYQKGDFIYAIRDHIGTVPLYFRFFNNEIKFSVHLTSLIDSTCELDPEGVRYFIAIGTPKLQSLFKEIMIVPPGSVMKIDIKTHNIQIISRYKITPTKLPIRSLDGYVDRLDELFSKAAKQTCKFDKVGIYLSGGIDSALTSIYLKKLGTKINAYTSAPWGRKSSEIPFAKMNVDIIGVENHYIDFLETDKYKEALSFIPELYKDPHGTTTAIGVASLWKHSPLKKEKQIYGAQGADTITCSVGQQYICYFLNFLPQSIRKKLHKDVCYKTLLENYISLNTNGLISNWKELKEYLDPSFSSIDLLSLGGIYIGHIPADGEVLSGPVINNNSVYSNLFYDIDVIKFFLSIPLRYRLAFSKDTKTKVYMDKLIIRKLAERYLPKDLVWRKKGWNVSLERDEQTQSVIANLPEQIFDIPLKNNELKFRARILLNWGLLAGIPIIKS